MSLEDNDRPDDRSACCGSGGPTDGIWTTGGAARRRFLQAAGAAGALGLAGCSGSESIQTTTDKDPTTTDEPQNQQETAQGQAVDPEFTAQLSITNPNLNFNEFNFANYSWTLTNMLMDPLAQWNYRTDEWVPLLAKDWTITDGKLTMDIRQGYHWHTTGEPVTAEDAAKSFWLELQMGWSVSEYATDVSAKDKWTVVFDLKDQLNRNVLEHELLGGTWVNKPPHIYEKWIKKFENAEGDDAVKKVQKKLSKWTRSEPFGYGPLKVTEMNKQRMLLEPFEGHPKGEAMNFDTYAFEYIGGGNNKVWQSMRANNIDAVPNVFAPKQVVDELPDNWMMTTHPSYGGYGVAFDHEHPDLKKRKVRQAIAHVIKRPMVAKNAGSLVKTPIEYIDGLAPGVSEKWFADWQSTLTAYEYSPKKASELMRSAGYQRQGQFWRGPNGRLKLKLVAPAGWSDWVTAAKTITSQLKAFGINAQLSTVESGTYNSELLPSGNWDIASYGWGGGPYPLFSYQQMWEEDDFKNLNYSKEVTVPKWDGSGTMTVNLLDLMQSINQSGENDKQGFKKLAWVWNQDLPIVQVTASQSQSFITTDDWEVPSKDAETMAYEPPCLFLPKFGELRAKTK